MNKTGFVPIINKEWCKKCGLCVAFCPKNVFILDSLGNPKVCKQKECTGCRICEFRCPDFAIKIDIEEY